MIKESTKNLLKTKADIIAHQTNCKGVMGAGVARQIRDNLLDATEFDKYVVLCKENANKNLGTVQFLELNNGKILANLFGEDIPTGKGLDTDYVALKKALKVLKDYAEENRLSVALPGLIGCGLAGGDWAIVRGMIEEMFADSSVNVEICYLPTANIVATISTSDGDMRFFLPVSQERSLLLQLDEVLQSICFCDAYEAKSFHYTDEAYVKERERLMEEYAKNFGITVADAFCSGQYTTLEAVKEDMEWLKNNVEKQIEIGYNIPI